MMMMMILIFETVKRDCIFCANQNGVIELHFPKGGASAPLILDPDCGRP